ncbi:hypothetical protein FRB96_004917 [Tulasnella sp. 330]|nr:hypothetical protein FRB96_004917 [Tulasnella sp. 330]
MKSKPLPYDTTPSPYTSIRDIVIKQAEKHGDLPAIRWLGDSGEIDRTLSYNDLHRLAFSAARYMRNQGVEQGDRVALVYTASLDFFVAFLACQVLRAAPVPIPCRTLDTIATDLPSVLLLLQDLKPAVTILQPIIGKMLLATNAVRPDPRIVDIVSKIGNTSRLGMRVLDVFAEYLGGKALPDEKWDGDEGEDIQGLAFIQYTSGSTNDPKGVVVSHRNVNHQLAYFSQCMNESIQSGPPGRDRLKLLAWLPHWSASSLVGSFLWSLHDGIECYFMSHSEIARNPLLWLKVLSEQHINISSAPNSVYGSVLRAWKATPPEKRPTLAVGGLKGTWDFSQCLQLQSVGEPLQGSVIREFFSVFKYGGLNPSAFKATYGVAEHMYFIAMSGMSHDPLFTVQGKVSVGGPRWGVDIKIVDPTTKDALPQGQEGEIWVNSESKVNTYLHKKAGDGGKVSQAKINGQPDGPEYLCTGDLGFMVENQLFISGRLEGVVMANGRHHFLVDIEQFMTDHEGVIKNMMFSLPPAIESTSGRSSLVCLMELKEDYLKDKTEAEKLNYCSYVARKVLVAKSLQISTIILLPPHAIPRSITGKIVRADARARYIAGDIQGTLFQWNSPVTPKDKKRMASASTTTTEHTDTVTASPNGVAVLHDPVLESVRREWESVFRGSVDNWSDFFAMGGSPGDAWRIMDAIQNNLPCPAVRIHHLMENPTLLSYAGRVRQLMQPSSEEAEGKRVAERQRWLWDQVALPDNFSAFLPRNRHALVDPVIAARHPAENVFLTGATGGVGSFILSELLTAHKTPSIYCLVRAKTAAEGHERLVDGLNRNHLWKSQYAGRIIPVIGDLTAVRFGIPLQTFNSIAADIKAVIHCGGSLDLFLSYEMQEGQNVSGTKEAIRLALSNCRGTPVPLHCVSTIAVFNSLHNENISYVREGEAQHPPAQSFYPGLAQTKWVAEQLVLKAARDYDLSAAVYRVGPILGHSETETPLQLDGAVNLFFENIGALGVVSREIMDMRQCFSTVDFASKTIAASAMAPLPRGQVDFYHAINGQNYPSQRIIEVFEKATGESLDMIRSEEWWRILGSSVPVECSLRKSLSSPPQSLSESSQVIIVSLNFLALASVYLPHDPVERRRVRDWQGREWSTVQLQDRLRRLGADSPHNDLYQRLLDGLRRPTDESLDEVLAVGLKSMWQEHKEQELLSRQSSTSLVTRRQQSTQAIAQHKATFMMPAQRATFDLKGYLSNTHALAFLSLLLYILLGD